MFDIGKDLQSAFDDGYRQAMQDRWIQVSERLPKKSGYYLCTADWYDIHAKYVIARLVRKVFFCEYSKEFKNWYDETGEYKVLAWQPLPEPWKGDKDIEN